MLKRSILIAALAASPLIAQNNRSAVSVNGSDSNPCTVTAPCRSFSAAMSHTIAGGEIVALDSAGYGPFAINQSVTVGGAPGIHAAISVPLNAGISVGAGTTDRIVIRNLVFVGVGGTYGIDVSSAGETRVFDCLFSGFASAGIHVIDGNVVIDRATIVDNPGTTGVDIGSNTDPLLKIQASITHSTIDNNYNGVIARNFTRMVMTDSTISNNSYGVTSTAYIGDPQTQLVIAEIAIENCTFVNNSNALYTFGGGGGNDAGVIFISQNVIAYNVVAIAMTGHSFVTTFDNNRFVGNSMDVQGGTLNTAVTE